MSNADIVLCDEQGFRDLERATENRLVDADTAQNAVVRVFSMGGVVLVITFALSQIVDAWWLVALTLGLIAVVGIGAALARPGVVVAFARDGVSLRRKDALELVMPYAAIRTIARERDTLILTAGARTLRISRIGSREPGVRDDVIGDARRYLLSRTIEARGIADDLAVATAYLRQGDKPSDYRSAPPRDALRVVADASFLPAALREAAARALE